MRAIGILFQLHFLDHIFGSSLITISLLPLRTLHCYLTGVARHYFLVVVNCNDIIFVWTSKSIGRLVNYCLY